MFRPRPAITRTESVTEESFLEAFHQHESAFREAEARCDAGSMWTITSNLAEKLLAEETKGHARSKEPKIVQSPNTGRDTDLGTVVLRKLHNLRSKAHFAKKHPDQENVLKRLRTLQEDLARSLPVLHELNVMTTEGTQQLEQIISERENDEQKRRLGRWQHSMQEDDRACMKWLCLTSKEEKVAAGKDDAWPQTLVQEEADKWQEIWNEEPPPASNVDSYLHMLTPDERTGAPSELTIDVTRNTMHKRLQKMLQKAGGADGWLPRDIALLPKCWFALMSRTWNVVLKGSEVPSTWAQIKVGLIPKHDGTGNFRPIGVAAVAWRLGMAEIIHMHRTWLQRVLDPDICSGPDRDPCELVDRLEAQLTDAKEGGQPLCAAQIDLSKCFDRVDPQRSLRILRYMGVQETVLGAIGSFYRQRKMFMQMGGAVAGPISTKRGLLQGCPASVLLLLVDMNIWIKFVKQSSPNTEIGVCADDRTLWARGAHARTDVAAAAEASAKYDREAGWKWNEGKGAVITRGKMDDSAESRALLTTKKIT